ncbi:DUF4381 domain-containing protein [Thiocapsa marina]|uniref:DUF4381 domain-containing protein n=1 Tax=Thiocapsa marina 5811 TaxID=768671 RepID=F9UHD9_9GAMM|nr:DUF4381 domain-containing protein [Thiocapsa marina]EGV16397.1 hypothetical protein ThimaDRAFT_4342 [Thiocapsa marina 5811]
MNGDPLAQLRDWHLPDPIQWWPPAPGWWISAAVLLAVLFWVAGARWRRHRRRGAAARSALRELAALRAAVRTDGDTRAFVAALSRLLRRFALARFPREKVAGLTGDAWLAFLDATGGGDGFRHGPGRALADLVYGANRAGDPPPNPDALAELAEAWIRANRRHARPAIRMVGGTLADRDRLVNNTGAGP